MGLSLFRVAALGYIGESTPEVQRAVADALLDSNRVTVINALFAARRLKIESVVERVRPYLNSPDEEIQIRADHYFQVVVDGERE